MRRQPSHRPRSRCRIGADAQHGREVGLIATVHFICRPTRKEAQDYHQHVLAHTDDEAVDNLLSALGLHNAAAVQMGARLPEGASVLPEEQYRLARVNFITGHGAFGPLVGTPDDIADGLQQLSEAGYDGLALGLISFSMSCRMWRRKCCRGCRREGCGGDENARSPRETVGVLHREQAMGVLVIRDDLRDAPIVKPPHLGNRHLEALTIAAAVAAQRRQHHHVVAIGDDVMHLELHLVPVAEHTSRQRKKRIATAVFATKGQQTQPRDTQISSCIIASNSARSPSLAASARKRCRIALLS